MFSLTGEKRTVRRIKVAIALVFAISLLGLMPARSMAYPPWVAKAKKFGAKDCTFCHVEPEGGPPWNARGTWLIKEKEKRNADAIDVEWLADYKPGPEKPADKPAPGKKEEPKTEPEKPATATSAEQELLNLEREWLEAYIKRDVVAMERILADDFLIVYPDGNMLTRADEIAALRKPAPAGGTPALAAEESKVRVYGDAAVITGILAQKGTHADGPSKGTAFESRDRYTDVYVKRAGRWQVVSSQLTAIKPKQSVGAAFDLDTGTLDSFVGQYELPMFKLAVTREGNRLYGQPPGDVRKELVAVSENEFLVAGEKQDPGGPHYLTARFTFVKDKQTGQVTGVKVHVAGQSHEGRKVQ
jgi:ketosteroid isomerase-like protein